MKEIGSDEASGVEVSPDEPVPVIVPLCKPIATAILLSGPEKLKFTSDVTVIAPFEILHSNE